MAKNPLSVIGPVLGVLGGLLKKDSTKKTVGKVATVLGASSTALMFISVETLFGEGVTILDLFEKAPGLAYVATISIALANVGIAFLLYVKGKEKRERELQE